MSAVNSNATPAQDGELGDESNPASMRSPLSRVPTFHEVYRTSPRKYGEPPGKMRIIRRNRIMGKGDDESIMPNPYVIAQGLQWQGFAGSYRTNKNLDSTDEKNFFITYDMGPLSNSKKKPMLQTIKIQRNFTAEIERTSSRQRNKLPPLNANNSQKKNWLDQEQRNQQDLQQRLNSISHVSSAHKRSRSTIKPKQPVLEQGLSFANERGMGHSEMSKVRIGINLSPVKFDSARRRSKQHLDRKDLYYDSIFNHPKSNYLAFEPQIARTLNRIRHLNNQSLQYTHGKGIIFDQTKSGQEIGSHLQEANPILNDPIQMRMQYYQDTLDKLENQQVRNWQTDNMLHQIRDQLQGVKNFDRLHKGKRSSLSYADKMRSENDLDGDQNVFNKTNKYGKRSYIFSKSKNANKLQSFFKGVVARMRYKRYKAKKLAAITKIQAFFKMKWARAAYQKRLADLYWHSAMLIQKNLRGFLVFKEHREEIHRLKADKLYQKYLKMRKDDLIDAKIKIWWAWKLKKRRKKIKAAKKKKKAKKGKKKKKKKDPAEKMVKAGEGGILDLQIKQGEDGPPEMDDDEDEEEGEPNNADIEDLDGVEEGTPRPDGEEGEDGELKPEGEDNEQKAEGEEGELKAEGEEGEPKPEGEEAEENGQPKPDGDDEEDGEAKAPQEGEEGEDGEKAEEEPKEEEGEDD